MAIHSTRADPSPPDRASAAVTWLGHSTVLIEVAGARFLTDPVLRRRVGPLTRRMEAADPRDLLPLDGVLLSHVHRDHLDTPTLRRLGRDVPIVAPTGVGGLVGHGRTVHEIRSGETLDLAGVTIRATPAAHRVRRRFRDVPSLGFVVAGRIYFAGDTAPFDEMSSLTGLDMALLPVWGWGTSLGPGHMDPEAAAGAVATMRPRAAMPIHWGTYFPAHAGRRGHPLLRDPPRVFARLVGDLVASCRVVIPAPGERVAL